MSSQTGCHLICEDTNINKKVIKFLHIADIHLNAKKYNNLEKSLDYYRSLKSVIQKYAIDESVAFVVIAGDLFDVRAISPIAMNQAVEIFTTLQNANIEVAVVEGNHDSLDKVTNVSWLHSLAKWGLIKLLEPTFTESGVKFEKWDSETLKGGYIEFGDVRIYGSMWFGASVSDMLTKIVDTLRDTHDPSKYSMMMLHTDVDGILSKHIKGVAVEKLKELKTYINYLALGHTHKNFEIDDFAFNPGSLDYTAIDQFAEVRGAYLVEVDTETKKHTARLMTDYEKREAIRLSFMVGQDWTPEEFSKNFLDFADKEIVPYNGEGLAPVLEITITGVLGFKTSLLELNKLRELIKAKYRPLLVLLKNHTLPVDFAPTTEHNTSRGDRERQVVRDLVAKDPRYKDSLKMADIVFEVKKMALSGESPDKIVQMFEDL